MKVEDLTLFTVVVKLGSFTAAANALDLPRGNVSRRISELEQDLGVALFFRTTRQLSLTQHGEAYHQKLLKALEALEQAKDAAQQVSDSPKGKIKFGLLPESDGPLQDIIFSFQDKYPDIELDIRIINNGFLDMYPQGLDLAVHGGELLNSNIIARKVFGLKRILVASPEYLAQNLNINKIQDIENCDCVCYRWPNGEIENQWHLNDEYLQVGTKLTSNSIGFVKNSIIHGRGIGFLPQMLVGDEIRNGTLIHLLPDYCSAKDDIWLLSPEHKGISRVTRLLIDHLLTEMPKFGILS